MKASYACIAAVMLLAVAVGSEAMMPHITARLYEQRMAAMRAQGATHKGDTPPAMYHEQMLDHFDALNRNTFLQRYYVNDTFFTDRENGPVFLFVEGEGSASPFDVLYGEHMVLAEKYGALVFAVEHRYYGHSNPVPDLSTENMVYLSSHQALADLSVFHTFATQNYGLSEKNTWISFGGSYPGALSSWVREKYPNVIYGAVASSAPVNAVENFVGYMDVVTASLSAPVVGGSTECAATVKAAMQTIDAAITTPAGLQKITQQFNTCAPVTDVNDTMTFVANIAGYFQGTVQYNAELPNQPTIASICAMLTTPAAKNDPVDALVKVTQVYLDGKCMDNSYAASNAGIMNTTVDPEQMGVGIRQWIWQTCTQFGFYQTCDPGTDCIFSNMMTLLSNTDLCYNAFGVTQDIIGNSVNFTNSVYGAKEPGTSRVVFVNGSIDPWHWLSVLAAVDDDSAVFIDGTAHCANMMPATPNDPAPLVAARVKIDTQVGAWLAEAAAAHAA